METSCFPITETLGVAGLVRKGSLFYSIRLKKVWSDFAFGFDIVKGENKGLLYFGCFWRKVVLVIWETGTAG